VARRRRYRVGGGVSAPARHLRAPDPEFPEEARKGSSSTVVLFIVVVRSRAHDVRIVRSLGMGLDEKALEAIGQWKFEAGRKDGVPVAVQVNVEISFRLY
jgi:TonB family protein